MSAVASPSPRPHQRSRVHVLGEILRERPIPTARTKQVTVHRDNRSRRSNRGTHPTRPFRRSQAVQHHRSHSEIVPARSNPSRPRPKLSAPAPGKSTRQSGPPSPARAEHLGGVVHWLRTTRGEVAKGRPLAFVVAAASTPRSVQDGRYGRPPTTARHREEIRQLKYRYQRGVDQHDWVVLAGCFADDAVCSYSDGKYAFTGPDAIVAFLRSAMDSETLLSSHQFIIPRSR